MNLIRFWVCILFLSGSFSFLYAQKADDPDLGPTKYNKHEADSFRVKKYAAIGLHAATNSCFNGQTDKTTNSDIGFAFDIYEVFDLNNKWTMQGSIGIVRFGGKNLQYGNKNQRNDTLFHFSYVFDAALYFTVPVLLKYRYSDKSNFVAGIRLSAMIEPFGSSVDGYIVKGIAYYTNLPVTNDGLPPGSNTFDISPLLGYEYHFNRRLYATAMVNIGLIPIFTKSFVDQNGTVYPIGAGNNNTSVSIGVCYDFLKN